MSISNSLFCTYYLKTRCCFKEQWPQKDVLFQIFALAFGFGLETSRADPSFMSWPGPAIDLQVKHAMGCGMLPSLCEKDSPDMMSFQGGSPLYVVNTAVKMRNTKQ